MLLQEMLVANGSRGLRQRRVLQGCCALTPPVAGAR